MFIGIVITSGVSSDTYSSLPPSFCVIIFLRLCKIITVYLSVFDAAASVCQRYREQSYQNSFDKNLSASAIRIIRIISAGTSTIRIAADRICPSRKSASEKFISHPPCKYPTAPKSVRDNAYANARSSANIRAAVKIIQRVFFIAIYDRSYLILISLFYPV